METWALVENTLYGYRKAEIFKSIISGRIKIKFYTLKGSYLCTNYYKSIPAYVKAVGI